MTTSPVPARPPYDVIAVFDHEGDEPPFAYTVGVYAGYGGPELFAWGTPDDGLDPDERWALSMHDLHAQLTRAVDRLRSPAGLALGDSWSTPLDGGRSSLVATVVETGNEPFHGVSPGTPVRRLQLTLLRPPPGRHVPLDAAARRRLTVRTRRWGAALGAGATGPVREDDVFGPCSGGVRLVLAHLAQLDEDGCWGVAVLDTASRGGSSSVLVEAGAVARTAGRHAWAQAAVLEVDRLVEERLQRVEPAERDTLRWPVRAAYEAAVTTWVLADLLEDELFRRGTATLRTFAQIELVLECDEPADTFAPMRLQAARTALDEGWRPELQGEDALLAPRARWVLAWSGRGRAFASLVNGCRLPADVEHQEALDVLAAAVVLDVDDELSALLPPAAAPLRS